MKSKSLFSSRTFWVNLVALLVCVGAMFGIDLNIDEASKEEIATTAVTAAEGISIGGDKVAILASAFMSLVNIVLRIVTTKPVHV